jgi:hypothetical protein
MDRASIYPLYPDREQPATLFTLYAEFNGAAANLAILDIRRLVGSQVNARFQPLTAIGTLDRNEFLGQQPGQSRSGLVNGFQAVQGIDATRVEVGNTAGQRLQLSCFWPFHFTHSTRRLVAGKPKRLDPASDGANPIAGDCIYTHVDH